MDKLNNWFEQIDRLIELAQGFQQSAHRAESVAFECRHFPKLAQRAQHSANIKRVLCAEAIDRLGKVKSSINSFTLGTPSIL